MGPGQSKVGRTHLGLFSAHSCLSPFPLPVLMSPHLPRTREGRGWGSPSALLAWGKRCWGRGKMKENQSSGEGRITVFCFVLFCFFDFFFSLGLYPRHIEIPWGQIQAKAAGLHHSHHSNAGSQLHLRPTPQLMPIPDP